MNDPNITAWAQRVSDLIADAEISLIREIRNQLYRDVGVYRQHALALADLATLRATVTRRLSGDWEKVLQEAQTVLNDALEAGQDAANRDLREYHKVRPVPVPEQTLNAVTMIARETLTTLSAVPPLILRDVLDAYRDIMAQPVLNVVTGAARSRKAMEQALGDYARAGIGAFTDKSGRVWRLDSYAEMAVRTGAMRAMREGYKHTLAANGFDLVQVTGRTYTCDKCAPWQGAVLSISPLVGAGVHRYPHAITGEPVAVRVAATLDDAKAEGLFHPNCTHRTVAYQPGISHPVPADTSEDEDTYKASQKQRALEREIRKCKRELAAAFTPETVAAKKREIRVWQSKIRDLIDEYPSLQRRYYRERNLGASSVPARRWRGDNVTP